MSSTAQSHLKFVRTGHDPAAEPSLHCGDRDGEIFLFRERGQREWAGYPLHEACMPQWLEDFEKYERAFTPWADPHLPDGRKRDPRPEPPAWRERNKAANGIRKRVWDANHPPKTNGSENVVAFDSAHPSHRQIVEDERSARAAQIAALASETKLNLENAELLYHYRYPPFGNPSYRKYKLDPHEIKFCEAFEEEFARQKAKHLVSGTNGRTGANGRWDESIHGRAEQPSETGPLPFVDMSKWDEVPAPPRHWLIHDRIPRRQPTLLYGHGETGKSTLLLQLLCATVLSNTTNPPLIRDWIGLLPEPGPAIYLGAEEEEDELHRRLDPILKFYGRRYADLIEGGFHLLSYAGKDMVLGVADRQGRIEPTDLYDRLYREACALQPKLVAIDGLSDIFVGNEIVRGQVRQFMGLFRRLGIDADCAPVISAHPSLEGMRSGTGLSGTTQWFNSIRAQMYLKTASEDEDEENEDNSTANDLRELQFLKNQYGRKGPTIRLQWKDGLYLLVQSQGTLATIVGEHKADDMFLQLLRSHTSQGRNVSDKTGTNYAPAILARKPEAKKAKIKKDALEDAMERLLDAKKIEVIKEGPPSKQRRRIAEVKPASTDPSTDLTDPSTASTAPKSGHNENESTRWKGEPTCAGKTGTSALPPPLPPPLPPASTGVCSPPPLYPPAGGSGSEAVEGPPLPPAAEKKNPTAPGSSVTPKGLFAAAAAREKNRRSSKPQQAAKPKSDDFRYDGPIVTVPESSPDTLDKHGAPLAATQEHLRKLADWYKDEADRRGKENRLNADELDAVLYAKLRTEVPPEQVEAAFEQVMELVFAV
jgi:RecA-family ATPase